MARVRSIAAIAWLVAGCLSSPSGEGSAIDASPRPDASLHDAAPPADDGGFAIVDEMTVPGDCTVVTSAATLAEGVSYRLVVDGVITLGTTAEADAEYFWFLEAPEDIRDGTGEVDVGLALDDLVIDENRTPNWGTYRSDHHYELDFIGLNAAINAQFHDSDCGNNREAFTLVVLGPPA